MTAVDSTPTGPPSTLIPLAYDAFLTFIQGCVSPPVEVVDALLRKGQATAQVVCLDGAVVLERLPATGFGPMGFSIEEKFELLGHIRCNAGDGQLSIVRAQAFDIFFAIEAAVRSDPTLGTGGGTNTVRLSYLKQQELTQGFASNNAGSAAHIGFSLYAEGRIS